MTLTGEITVIEDKNVKDALWQPWLAKHFPNGGKDDPEYAVLRFDAREATIYINNNFQTIKLQVKT